MNKILKVVVALIMVVVINYGVIYFLNVAFENDSEIYPEEATLTQIFLGKSEILGVNDFEIWNWANEYGKGPSAATLSYDILNHTFQKCNKWETVLICMLQNRFNAKLSFFKYNVSPENLSNTTVSVEYIRILGKDYIMALYRNVEMYNENGGSVIVGYKTSDDIYSTMKDFETKKENYYEVFPIALTFLLISDSARMLVCIYLIIEFVFLWGVTSKLMNKSNKKSIRKNQSCDG